jgi:hypothetical protein
VILVELSYIPRLAFRHFPDLFVDVVNRVGPSIAISETKSQAIVVSDGPKTHPDSPADVTNRIRIRSISLPQF